jgi:uncharacterized protein (DUF2252 family)
MKEIPRSPGRLTTSHDTRAVRLAAGIALRQQVPRGSHAAFKPQRKGRDPIAILQTSNRDRLPDLIPIRFGRMLPSPFTFLRGSAGVMAYDLASTPDTRLFVQACGDCHVMNFGLFATPERNLVFDINDFDETHPAPWEWDLKRLGASFVVAARDSGLSEGFAKDVVMRCARAYRRHMRGDAHKSPLAVWYERLHWQTVIDLAPNRADRKAREGLAEEARHRVIDHLFPKIATEEGGRHRLVDQPPLVFHPAEKDFETRAREGLARYRDTLAGACRVLFDRFRAEDFAAKVVGIGSVGTRCYLGLFVSGDDDPLILQFKEAVRSVLEPYTSRSAFQNQGERVVMGQWLMQSSSDIFLGWARGRLGRDFYVRQLRDMKLSVPLDSMSRVDWRQYAEICGWTLARAHAKSGDPAAISGYLGKSGNFDRALAEFAAAYADQVERDHAALVKAVRAGRVQAVTGEGE